MDGELFAFVIMPFDPEFEAVYEKLIVPALTAAGYRVSRADKTLDQRNILKDIIPNIGRADLIVADITTRNANVFYELGVAHTLPKPVVMIIQDVEDIPFDLQSYRVIKYSTRFDKADILGEELRKIAAAHREGKVTFENPVVDFIPELPRMGPVMGQSTEHALEKPEITTVPEERPEEGEAGVVDLMVEAEAAAEEYGQAMNELVELTKVLTERHTRHGEALKSVDMSAPGSASKVQGILKAMGLDMVVYSENVNSLAESRLASLERLIDAGERLVTHPRAMSEEYREQLQQLRPSLVGLQATLADSERVLQETSNSTLGLGGFSRVLDVGVHKIEQAYNRLRTSVISAEARLARLVNLIDERLGRTEPD